MIGVEGGPCPQRLPVWNQSFEEIDTWLINKNRVLQSSLCVSLLRVSRLHFMLEIQSKIDLGARIDPILTTLPYLGIHEPKDWIRIPWDPYTAKNRGQQCLEQRTTTKQHLNDLHMHLESDTSPRETSPLQTESPKSLVQSTYSFGVLRQALGWISKKPLNERNKDLLINPLVNDNEKFHYIRKTKQNNK